MSDNEKVPCSEHTYYPHTNGRKFEDNDALNLAIRFQHLECARTLLNAGADMYAEGLYGSAFHSVFNHSEIKCEAVGFYQQIIELLLEFGADVNKFCDNNKKVSALHTAAHTGCLICVNFLLDHGADPNLRGENGILPLQEIKYALGCMEALLHKGADPNRVGLNGNTPLMDNYPKIGYQMVQLVVCRADILICGGADYTKDLDFQYPEYKAFMRAVVTGLGGDDGIKEERRKFALN